LSETLLDQQQVRSLYLKAVHMNMCVHMCMCARIQWCSHRGWQNAKWLP